MRELLPDRSLIAVVFGPTTPTTEQQIGAVEGAAQALGQPILVLQARDDLEVETAFAKLSERQANGVVYGASTYFQAIADKLVALAARYRIPAMYEWQSYSTNRRELARLAGDYTGRILKGAAPADLPVVQSSRFELVINLNTAKALGLTVPQSLLARADEVIE